MKKLCLALLSVLTIGCAALGLACTSGDDSKPQVAFNEGYLTEVVLGEPIMLDEYVDPDFREDYTLTLVHDETGIERNLKEVFQWTTDLPGTYTLTYTVTSGAVQGTVSTKIEVVVPKVTWQYSRPTLVYRVGDTMEFGYLKRQLNLMVKSYYSYEFYVNSVKFGDETVTLGEEYTNYTFTDDGEHVFNFSILTEDGQRLSADQKITVRPQQILTEGAEEWMAENNITVYDYTYVSPDGKISLDAGYYNTPAKDNVPYLAFNGENGEGYGAQTYMMVDFTGKNLPQVAFFADPSPSFTDGKDGILFSNGISNNNGSDYFGTKLDMSRLTIFGPNKASFAEFDNRARLHSLGSVADPCPMSFHALNDTDSYRYIVGFSEATRTYVTLRILLINMTTMERVFDFTQKLTSSTGIGALNLSEDYLKGSIVLYGRYGRKSVWDKVYMPITDVDDIYDLDIAASFKDSYMSQCDLNTKAYVSDYIYAPATEYEFKVFAPTGEEVEVADDGSFVYTMSGKYTLYFNPMQDGVRASAITVRVMYDLDNPPTPDFYEIQGAIMAGVTDGGVKTNTLNAYIKEGKQSIECYTISGNSGSIEVGISRNFLEFVFLSRRVQGITFEVYSLKDATFKLGGSDNIVKDYTGEVSAKTWTKLTITRELYLKNFDIYSGKGHCLSIQFTPTEGKYYEREFVMIDDVQLIIQSIEGEISSKAKAFLEENDITVYGSTSVNKDLKVALQAGTYQKEWWNLTNDDVPYVAYNGNYGKNTYVVVDFTGKNVPQIALFVDKVTSSLADKNQGLYIHTGMVKKNGALVSDTDGGRVTFLGPNKIEVGRPDAEGRVGKQYGANAWNADGSLNQSATPSPLSIRGLQDGVHYRYVVGVKEAKEEGTKGRITLELLLINLDTKQELVKYTWSEATEGLLSLIDGGSIVLYSRYNEATTLDKIYPLYTNIGSVYAIDLVAEAIS